MIARALRLALLAPLIAGVAHADLKIDRLTLEAWYFNPAGKPIPVRLPVALDGKIDDTQVRGWKPARAPAFLRVRISGLELGPKTTGTVRAAGDQPESTLTLRPDLPSLPFLLSGNASLPLFFTDLSRVNGQTVTIALEKQPPLKVGPLQLAPPPSLEEIVVNPIYLARIAEANRLVQQKGAALWPDFKLDEVPVLLRASESIVLLTEREAKLRPLARESQRKFALVWTARFGAPTGVQTAGEKTIPRKFQKLVIDSGLQRPLYVITDEQEADDLDGRLGFDPFGMLRGELAGLVGSDKKGHGAATVRMTPVLGQNDDENAWGAAEENLSTLIHEGFHVHQFHRGWMKRKGLSEGNAVIIESPFFTAEQAALFECEARALRASYGAKDEAEAQKCVREFLACRYTRWKRQNDPGRKDLENLFESIEGLAAYVAFKAMALAQEDYQPLPELQDDFGFHGYRNWNNGRPQLDEHAIPFVPVNIMEQKTAYYNVGTLAGLALDRLLPNWKTEYETTPVQLDQLLARATSFKVADAATMTALLAQAKMKYDYAAHVKQAQQRLREQR